MSSVYKISPALQDLYKYFVLDSLSESCLEEHPLLPSSEEFIQYWNHTHGASKKKKSATAYVFPGVGAEKQCLRDIVWFPAVGKALVVLTRTFIGFLGSKKDSGIKISARVNDYCMSILQDLPEDQFNENRIIEEIGQFVVKKLGGEMAAYSDDESVRVFVLAFMQQMARLQAMFMIFKTEPQKLDVVTLMRDLLVAICSAQTKESKKVNGFMNHVIREVNLVIEEEQAINEEKARIRKAKKDGNYVEEEKKVPEEPPKKKVISKKPAAADPEEEDPAVAEEEDTKEDTKEDPAVAETDPVEEAAEEDPIEEDLEEPVVEKPAVAKKATTKKAAASKKAAAEPKAKRPTRAKAASPKAAEPESVDSPTDDDY